jgi:hypothetical protein
MPGRAKGAHDAQTNGRSAAGRAHGQDQRTEPRFGRRRPADLDRLLEAEGDDIGAGIAAGERCLHVAPVHQPDRGLGDLREYLLRGHQDVVAP